MEGRMALSEERRDPAKLGYPIDLLHRRHRLTERFQLLHMGVPIRPLASRPSRHTRTQQEGTPSRMRDAPGRWPPGRRHDTRRPRRSGNVSENPVVRLRLWLPHMARGSSRDASGRQAAFAFASHVEAYARLSTSLDATRTPFSCGLLSTCRFSFLFFIRKRPSVAGSLLPAMASLHASGCGVSPGGP